MFQKELNRSANTRTNLSLCEKIVGNATNARDGTINAVHVASNYTVREIRQKMMPLIQKTATEKLPPAARDALVNLCSEDFARTDGNLVVSITFIKMGDKEVSDSYLSSSRHVANECRDAVNSALYRF